MAESERIRDRKTAEAKDTWHRSRAEQLVALGQGTTDVEVLLDEAAAEYRAALEAWKDAPLDRHAQTRINEAVWKGRLVWRLYQKVVAGGRTKADTRRVPLGFQEPIVFWDKSGAEKER